MIPALRAQRETWISLSWPRLAGLLLQQAATSWLGSVPPGQLPARTLGHAHGLSPYVHRSHCRAWLPGE